MWLENLKRSSDFSWGKHLKFKQKASWKDYSPNLHLTSHKVFGARILAVFIDTTLQNIVRMFVTGFPLDSGSRFWLQVGHKKGFTHKSFVCVLLALP